MTKENKKELIIQFIKFGVVGVSNTFVHLAIYYLLLFLNVNYIIANSLGFIISVLNAYFWNNKFVFNKKKENNEKDTVKQTLKKLAKVYASYTFTFILSNILIYVWVDLLHISDKIAPIINSIITIPINFLMNKLWAFGKQGESKEKEID